MKRKSGSQTVLFFHSRQRDRTPAEEKLRGIYRFARACGWKIVILEAPCSREEVRQQIRAWKPLGCIVDMNVSDKLFTATSLERTPTAFLDFDDRQLHGQAFRVNHDAEAVGALAAKHFLELGLTRFAFVGYTREWSWSNARCEAFRRHLGTRITSFDTTVLPIETALSSASRRKLDCWLASLPKPCGLLLADDGLANEVYPACARLSIAIPEDLAVLGADDNERFCSNLTPPLSSILLDFNQAGWMVAELLYRHINNPALKPTVTNYEPIGITPRASTALNLRRETPIAQKTQRLIHELASNGAHVADIASKFNCSRRLVELRFREATGKSILESIQDERLARACALLRDEKTPIETIARRCGYASNAALKALFKRRMGQTMSVWRKDIGCDSRRRSSSK